jgi:hypothetical protein
MAEKRGVIALRMMSMRFWNLLSLFSIAEAVLLYLLYKLFLTVDQAKTLWVLGIFALVQLALLATAMRVAELERDRGKNSLRIARERSRRERALAIWTGGFIYLARLGFGVRHVAD